MRYTLSFLLIPLFLHANDDQQQLSQLQWQRKQLIKHIQNPDSNKFRYRYQILTGEIQEPHPKSSIRRFLQTDSDQVIQDFKDLVGLHKTLTAPIDIEEEKEKARQDLTERIFAKKIELINRQEKTISDEKISSGRYYLFATFGFFSLGLLSYKGSLDLDDCKFLQPFIFESPIVIPLKSNLKTTFTLFGLGFYTAYHTAKDFYHGIFYSAINRHNLQEIRSMEEFIKTKEEKK